MRLRAEQFALRAPIEGQPGVIHQPVRGELRRMPAVQDRRDEVGSEECGGGLFGCRHWSPIGVYWKCYFW